MAERDNELAEEMLLDLAEESGISIDELLADAIEEIPSFEEFPVYEQPTEDSPLDLDNPYGEDTDEYFDALFDDIDVDADSEEDSYGDD